MRNLILIVSILSFIGCNTQGKVKLKKEPFDNLYYQRAYPDNFVDVDAVSEVGSQVRQEIALKTADAEWLSEGPGNIGGRINTIAVDPNNSDIIFIGNFYYLFC